MAIPFIVVCEAPILVLRIERSLIGISLTYLWIYHNEKLYYWN